jgi:hypothetical protein
MELCSKKKDLKNLFSSSFFLFSFYPKKKAERKLRNGSRKTVFTTQPSHFLCSKPFCGPLVRNLGGACNGGFAGSPAVAVSADLKPSRSCAR